MKKSITLIIFSIFFVIASFGQNKKEQKKAAQLNEYEAMKTFINEGVYYFRGTWATTYNGRRINLASNPTFLNMDHENSEGFFPFFGTKYSGRYGTNNGGIEFVGPVKNYKIKFNNKKQYIRISFEATHKSEAYDVVITVNRTGTATININSNNRSAMNYDGYISKLEKK